MDLRVGVNGVVTHLYLTGPQAVSVSLFDNGTLVSAELLREPGGRPMARIVGPRGEVWALVTALSEALVALGHNPDHEDPVTVVADPLEIVGMGLFPVEDL